MSDVIMNSQSKTVERPLVFQTFINSHNIFRYNILGTQPVAASADTDITVRGSQSALYIQVQGFTQRTRFLCAVQHSDFFDSGRNLRQEMAD